MLTFVGIGGQEILFLLLLVAGVATLIVLPIVALVSIVRSDFKSSNDKLMWVLIVLFLNFLGAVLYLSIGQKQRVNS